VKPSPFQYYDPETLDEALDLVATRENAKVLAGGQSLMPMLNMRYAQPDHIIDLNRIPGLDGIHENGGVLRIGAMTRQRELEFSGVVRERCPLMHEALLNVGHRQTRNRGTLGGSLCHLDPAAELAAVMMAYDGVVEVRSRDGTREIAMADFPAFYMTPAIRPDEIVVGARLAPWPPGHASAFLEFSRRHGDFAIVAVAALLDIDGDRRPHRASITVSGLTHKPERIAEAEAILCAGPPEDSRIRQAAAACGAVDATSDVHASAGYRQHLARTLAFRCVTTALQRAGLGQAEKRP
jgi:carbon-monoxide dehydrogenase medium subunit